MRFDLSAISGYILTSPRSLLTLAVAIGVESGLIWKQITEHQTEWIKATGTLENVVIEQQHLRVDSPFFTKAIYQFDAEGTKGTAISNETHITRKDAEERARLIKEYKQTTTLFYDKVHIGTITFYLDDVQMSWPNFSMLTIIMIGLMIYSMWMMKVRHDYLGDQ